MLESLIIVGVLFGALGYILEGRSKTKKSVGEKLIAFFQYFVIYWVIIFVGWLISGMFK